MLKESDVHDFIGRLSLLKHEAGQLGLWKTMHALEEPLKEVGYEVADNLTRYKSLKGASR